MLIIVLISILPALLLRFILFRKSLQNKHSVLSTVIILVAAMAILGVLNLGTITSSTVIVNIILWSYPILKFGSKKQSSISPKAEVFQGMKQKLVTELEKLPITSKNDNYKPLVILFEEVTAGTLSGILTGLPAFKGRSLDELEQLSLYLEVQFFLFFLTELMAFNFKQSEAGRELLRYDFFLETVLQDFAEPYPDLEDILDKRLAEYMAKFKNPGPKSNHLLSFLNHIYLVAEEGKIDTSGKLALYDAFQEVQDFIFLNDIENTLFHLFNSATSNLFKTSQEISNLSALQVQALLKEGIQESKISP